MLCKLEDNEQLITIKHLKAQSYCLVTTSQFLLLKVESGEVRPIFALSDRPLVRQLFQISDAIVDEPTKTFEALINCESYADTKSAGIDDI